MERARVVRGLRVVAVACLTTVLSGPGCAGDASQPDNITVSERITKNFGRQLVSHRDRIALEAGNTVTDMLERHHHVELESDGRSVATIDDISANQSGNRRWALSVNGIVIDDAPANHEPVDGDRIQWDLADRHLATASSATVGAYPHTFLRGISGRRVLTAVGCTSTFAKACTHIKRSLRAAGVTLRESTIVIDRAEAAAKRDGPDALIGAQVLIGAWHHLADHPWSQRLAKGPQASGVFARIKAGPDHLHYGDTLHALNTNGDIAHTLRRGTGLVAALRPAENRLFWLITGFDADGADLAAQALTDGDLHDTWAAVTTPKRSYPIPVQPPR